ncbi:MAG: sulfite exporter TauE/SafE family protein [candidate division Zixibacteria bacterium]|nr:sulfite exporter TauE/SafE family protein [candidate division Zixibacteria bacterium]
MELWTALVLGLAGSLHCIGMCGPIAVALPSAGSSKSALFGGRVVYNLGRILTYGLLGIIAGFVGRSIMVAGYQQGLSIALGLLILLAVITPSKYVARLTGAGWHASIFRRLKGVWQRMFQRSSIAALFIIGLLNGFLPCGLVYVALAGSINTTDPLTGAAYMVVFGAGTFPIMFAVAVFGNMVGFRVRQYFRRALPVAGVVLAVLFILRGLSLGIPYVSPEIQQDTQGEATMNCCGQNAPSEVAP